MSGFTIPVAVKGVTALGGSNLSLGGTIYNTDSVNGVWVSSNASVTPGNGMFVGPFGSVNWSSKDGLPYACVDTGVNALVKLLYSDDVSGIDNPVAVAASVGASTAAQIVASNLALNVANQIAASGLAASVAASMVASGLAASIAVQTAQQLLFNGVPNVLVESSIFSGNILAGQIVTLNVSAFASISINAQGGYGDIIAVSFNDGINELTADVMGGYGVSLYSVVGQYVAITNTTAHSIPFAISGSNRPALRKRDPQQMASVIDLWTLSLPGGGVAGTSYPLQQVNSTVNPGPYSIQLEGDIFANFQFLPNTYVGRFSLYDRNSPQNYCVMCDSGEMAVDSFGAKSLRRNIALPSGGYFWQFNCRTTSATAITARIEMVQA